MGSVCKHATTHCYKVQRFSPQDLKALRRAPTRPLGKMPILGADISVIVSEEPLEPVTATPADEEAISKASQAVRFVKFIYLLKNIEVLYLSTKRRQQSSRPTCKKKKKK